MLTGGTTGVAGDGDGEAIEDVLAFGDEDSGEVAVADAEVSVTEDDEVAGTGVVACLFHCAV